MEDRQVSLKQVLDEIARWVGYLDEDMIYRIQTGLKRLPSVQPEIIRCKECQYNTGLSKFIEDYYCCDYHEHIVRADDFCSDAKRREEGDE